MSEVVVTSIEGRRLVFSDARKGSDEGLRYFNVALVLERGGMTALVWDSGDELARLFSELAENWRGFEGEKDYTSLEGNLLIRCAHDRKGTLLCEVTLRDPAPPEWALTAELTLGAGAHVHRIASEIRDFVRG